jgi:hypothetical protein
MTHRKHISWKTKCAAALLSGGWGGFSYDEAKQLTEDQYLSLFHWDHNMLHSSGAKDRDVFWNLTPMFIKAHREKTKIDAKIIAKSRRLRAKGWNMFFKKGATPEEKEVGYALFLKEELEKHGLEIRPIPPVQRLLQIGEQELKKRKLGGWDAKRTIQSRGFDKTRRRKMDGTVIKRER